MKSCLKKNLCFLKKLANCGKKKRDFLVENASRDNINAISEIALNTLHGNVPLTTKQKKSLYKHRSTIRKLSNKRLSKKKKQILLVQKGGILPALVAPILSVLAGVATKAVGSALGL
jgi:hypothetical protein